MEQELTKRFKEFASVELFSLNQLVDFYLCKEPAVMEYSKQFFDVLVAYSFIQTKLDILEHGLPSIYISNILDYFATRPSKTSIQYFADVMVELSDLDTWEGVKLKEFADTFILFKGFCPKSFNQRTATPSYYQQMAKTSFKLLQRKPNDIYHSLSRNLDQYIYALNYMYSELLEGRYEYKEIEKIIC